MREIQARLARVENMNPALDLFLNQFVWEAFHKAKDDGKFNISVWIFHKDVSGLVSDLLTKWFGPDPDPKG